MEVSSEVAEAGRGDLFAKWGVIRIESDGSAIKNFEEMLVREGHVFNAKNVDPNVILKSFRHLNLRLIHKNLIRATAKLFAG